jgi:hypothetical protein
MTPKEKAIELVDKFTIPYYEWDGDGYNINWDETFKNRKQCALIAVDEILKTNPYKARNYWHEVKTEIEKL